MKPTSRHIPAGWYLPTRFGKLKAIPTFGLLNVIVSSAEADRLTNGAFDLELSLRLSAVVRELYDFPDFDREAADGVVLSVLPFLINPDDYIRERVGLRHVYAVLDALAEGRPNVPFDHSRLRASGTPDILTQATPENRPVYFKQRFISCCCVGPKPVLDRLWLEPLPDILGYWVQLLTEALGWGNEVFIVPHPTLEPAGRAIEVGRANQREWIRWQREYARRAGLEVEGFLKQPGSLPFVKFRQRVADGETHPGGSAGETL